MFKDDERALAIEKSAVVSVRIDLVQLTLWAEWMERAGNPASSVNQAVSSALGFAVDVLRANGQVTGTVGLGDAVNWLDGHRLFQRRMLGKKKKKLGAYMSFENMRMEGENPRTSDRLTRQVYEKTHANDERTILPLQMYEKIGIDIVKEEKEETITKKTIYNWSPETLTSEDIEELKKIWVAMTEDERAIIQKKVYRNNAAGEYERKEDIMQFYTRFKPIPEKYMPENLTQEIEDSDEYQEWAHDWLAKTDAFVRAMRAMIPELVGNRERLQFDEDGVVINVPSTGAGVITQEEYEAHLRQVEEDKKKAMVEKEKEKLLRKIAMKEAKEALGVPEKEQVDLEKEQEKLKKRIAKEEARQLERLSKLEEKRNVVVDKISTIRQMLKGEEDAK